MSLILRSLLVALALACGAQLARADTASPFGTGGPSAEPTPSEAPAASVMGVSSILVRRQLVLRLPESAVAGRAFSPAGPILETAIGAVLLCGALLLQTTS